MFLGSIPSELRSVVAEHISTWQIDELYVGCSGNVTIERAAWATRPGIHLHGCDVSIYSCMLGALYAGQPVDFRIAGESRPQLEWLEPYLDQAHGSMAVLMLCTRFLEMLGHEDHPYYSRMLTAYREQFPGLHATTKAKLEALPVKLTSFAAKDVRTWLRDDVPPDATVASFPPFMRGGYTKMFAALDKHLTWDAPVFEEMDTDDVDKLVDAYTERPRWILGLPNRSERLEEEQRAVVQTSIRNIPIYVYSSTGHHRIAKPRQLSQPVLVPRLHAGQEIGERLALAPLSAQQFSALRSQYLSRKIAPGGAALACGVLVDGKLIGAWAVNPPQFDPDTVYLLSDFAVAPTGYKNLSKLVLTAAMSNEARLLMERQMSRRLRRLTTTAFTDNMVSMKYRSIAQLDSRKDSTDGVHRYQLQYSADLGRWSLAEGFEQWRKRWGAEK